jgi:hypothetical protein
MLDDFVGKNEIEGVAGIGERFAGRSDHIPHSQICLAGSWFIEFQAVSLMGKPCQPGQVGANTTAVIQHDAIGSFTGGLLDQAQAPLLAGAPQIGWLTAKGSFVQVSFHHAWLTFSALTSTW